MNTNASNEPGPDNTSAIADIATAAENGHVRTARRNGKIARLPRKLRDLVNQLLDDGVTYAQILETLQQSTDPPLPYPLSEKNISTWHQGGYQDYLKFRETLDLLSLKLDLALDMARESERSPGHIHSLTRMLATIRICEFLSQFSIGSPEAPTADCIRLLSAFSRIGKEAVQVAKLQLELQHSAPAHSPAPAAPSTNTRSAPDSPAPTHKTHHSHHRNGRPSTVQSSSPTPALGHTRSIARSSVPNPSRTGPGGGPQTPLPPKASAAASTPSAPVPPSAKSSDSIPIPTEGNLQTPAAG